MNRRNHAISLQEATRESPTLARLADLATDSLARLRAIESLLPANLRSAVRAGPVEGDEWCLVLENSAVAAKIRQLIPSMELQLRSKGWQVNSIRLKVQTSRNSAK